jgi:hypothetical protein
VALTTSNFIDSVSTSLDSVIAIGSAANVFSGNDADFILVDPPNPVDDGLGNWSADPLVDTFTITFTESMTITNLDIYNNAGASLTDRDGITGFDITFNFADLTSTTLSGFTATSDGTVADSYDFVDQSNVDSIDFTITSADVLHNNGNRYAVREIQFFGEPIPEPSSFALMVLGLGGLYFLRRR